jgi:hypothetical protein
MNALPQVSHLAITCPRMNLLGLFIRLRNDLMIWKTYSSRALSATPK